MLSHASLQFIGLLYLVRVPLSVFDWENLEKRKVIVLLNYAFFCQKYSVSANCYSSCERTDDPS